MQRMQWALMILLFSTCSITSWSQQTPSSTTVPRLVRFSGTIKDVSGTPVTGVAGVTFALYKDQEGGAALWLETQNAQLDATGHYTVMLGAAKSEGLPTELFTSGEARWLGVQPAGQAEQPRVLLLSVPYALKAEDAETVGGLPPSAFMRSTRQQGASMGSSDSGNLVPALPPIVHMRWQIEPAFKRLKSLAQLGHVPKHDDRSSRAWLYGKLLVTLLAQKLIRLGRDISPSGYSLSERTTL